MYKIFINEHQLILQDKENTPPVSPNIISLIYRGKRKLLLNCIDKLEKANEETTIYILSDDVDILWKDFKKIYKIVEAAGGIVLNPDKKALIIFRRGFWDLPKGKIEKNESNQESAIREVEEETGLKEVRIDRSITTTYHTYLDNKNKRILKPTYWFLMHIEKEQELQLQYEEDIEKAIWVNPEDFLENPPKTYLSILTVLECSLS